MLDFKKISVGDKVYSVCSQESIPTEWTVLRTTKNYLLINSGKDRICRLELESLILDLFFHSPADAVEASLATLGRKIGLLEDQRKKIISANANICSISQTRSPLVGEVEHCVESVIRHGANTFPEVESSCPQFTPGQVRSAIWRLAHQNKVKIGPKYRLSLAGSENK